MLYYTIHIILYYTILLPGPFGLRSSCGRAPILPMQVAFSVGLLIAFPYALFEARESWPLAICNLHGAIVPLTEKGFESSLDKIL